MACFVKHLGVIVLFWILDFLHFFLVLKKELLFVLEVLLSHNLSTKVKTIQYLRSRLLKVAIAVALARSE